jgi:hypothetical protein
LNDKVQDTTKDKAAQLTEEDEIQVEAYSNVKEALEKTKENGNLLLFLMVIFYSFVTHSCCF